MNAATPPTGAPAARARQRTAPAAVVLTPADEVLRAFGEKARAIAEKTATLAEAGDVAAVRIVLDRIAPAQRERAVRFTLPPITGPKDLPAAALALTQAVARGELTPGEAQQMAGVLEQYRKQVETADLAERIAALEGAAGG